MKFFKLLLLLFALVFVVWGAFWLLGFAFVLVKWLVILGVIALAGVGAYKLLAGPEREEQAALSPAEAEMLKAERMLAELRRRELTK